MSTPFCPRCGCEARVMRTRFGNRHECCGLWSWHDRPLVDAKTHEARRAAHDAFDKVWKDKPTKRETAYAMLAKRLNIPLKDCHIALMSAKQAKMVPKIAKQMIEYLENA
jgi:zinc-finger-containing domain